MGGENEEIEADTIPILEDAVRRLRAENEKLKEMVIQYRIPNYCMGVECGCRETSLVRIAEDKIRLTKALENELKEREE